MGVRGWGEQPRAPDGIVAGRQLPNSYRATMIVRVHDRCSPTILLRMDDVAEFNQERWAALVRANALFTRPWLDLDERSARLLLDPEGWLPESVVGTRVLCLAGGGGRQSVAFALLGADVTVLDLSEGQLGRDREAAAQYGVSIRTIAGDMRDLSPLAPASFDLVWQPYSLNFVPDAAEVFRQVARVIRPGGLYHVMTANPFVAGIATSDWTGEGYLLRHRYIDGAPVRYEDEEWVYDRTTVDEPIPGPREYRHSLATIVTSLVGAGFVIQRVSETRATAEDPESGTWEHLKSIAPPWLTWWGVYEPGTSGWTLTPTKR